MFQNISRYTKDENYRNFENEENLNQDDVFIQDTQEEKKERVKGILKSNFSIRNCVIYLLTFMLSMVGGTDSSLFSAVAPFGFSAVAACFGAGIPSAVAVIVALIGTAIKLGANTALFYILTMLIFVAFILIKRPIEQEDKNEKLKVGTQMAVAVFVVQAVKMLFKGFLLYDLLFSFVLSITTFILYKIFVNSLSVIKDYGIKSVFSIEEVMGASLLLAIASNSLGQLSVFGFSIRNIISILIILVMGWKNGMLVGGTAGITIGTVQGILNGQTPVMLAAYAISGLMAGILNRLGKVGVIVGFIIGNILLSYVANGGNIEVIKFQEILIAALGLLAMPKTQRIKISKILSEPMLLPETTTRTLEENKETVDKLSTMSETISQMAKEYENAAATIVTDEELEKQEQENREIFEEELKNVLEDKEENLLYDDLYNNKENILDEIFAILVKNEVLVRKDLIEIFANHNNYIVGFSKDDDETNARNDIDEALRAINSSYRISKLNFVWKKKLNENKKTMSAQLSGVSEAIKDLANQITKDEDDKFAGEKEQIKKFLEEKDVILKDISIKQDEAGRFMINIYTGICDTVDAKDCNVKQTQRIIEKVLQEKLVLQKQKCGLRENDDTCCYYFTSEDKYLLQVGISKTKKENSIISGDTTIQTRLEDGKYLVAISDGMGSGPEARKSSKIAIKMLERLLKSGFNNDTAMKLINTTVSANTDDDMYATLDANIFDLYCGNMKFIKNGACPTFVKRNDKIEVLKAVALPTGILNNIDLVEYNYDLQDGDVILMCSDGILDSVTQYQNKELWIEEMLEDIETEDSQRIADLILQEAIDNCYGKEKDDMTVIVCKVQAKKDKTK